MNERARCEKWLAVAMRALFVENGCIAVADNHKVEACARIAADAIEKVVRAARWHIQLPLGVSIEPNDPMAALKLIQARNAAWKASEGPIPWDAVSEEGE